MTLLDSNFMSTKYDKCATLFLVHFHFCHTCLISRRSQKTEVEVCIVKSLNLLANAVIAGVLVHYICLITDAGFTYLLQIIF